MNKPLVVIESENELQAYREQLFAKKGIDTADKIHFVQLENIKTHFKELWDSSKVRVFDVVEQIISSYTTADDIVLRYREDAFIIIITSVSLKEAKSKVTVIVNEINRQYFYGFDNSEQGKTKNNGNSNVKVQSSDTLKKAKDEDYNPLNCTYTPLWNVHRNALISYLCLAQGDKNFGDPFDRHEAIFADKPPSKVFDLDLTVLKTVAYELHELLKRNGKLFIICPVHYETFSRREPHDRYIQACQKIPARNKKFLIFLVIGIPEKVHDLNMSRYFGALTKHCNAIYGQVPLNPKLDFHALGNSHFSVIGVRLKKVKDSEKEMIENLTAFNQAAKQSIIKQVFALDVSSLSITTSAVCAGFDILGGSAIHENVKRPSNAYRFMHQDLFANMITEHHDA